VYYGFLGIRTLCMPFKFDQTVVLRFISFHECTGFFGVPLEAVPYGPFLFLDYAGRVGGFKFFKD
jgi:hypothetical protein